MAEQHMAIDQYGTTYHGLGAHPRKALLDRLSRSTARRMYVDGADGATYHVGWVIGGLWLNVYSVEPMRVSA